MLQRMIGAARLDVNTYEEVENDENATMQALLVVIIVSIATGIGAIGAQGNLIVNFIVGIGLGIVGWAIWAYLTYFIGTKILNTPETHADWGQLARGTGFAQTPNLLRILGIIPVIGGIFVLAGIVLTIIAMVIAVRQCLDYTSTWRAIGVVVIAFIPYIIVVGIIAAVVFRATGTAVG